MDNNPAAPSAPKDFLSFDFTKMEHVGNALFHAKDDWAHAEEGPSALRYSSLPSAEQTLAEERWGENEPHVGKEIVTFVKNRMVVGNAFGVTMEEAPRRSLLLLSSRGTTRDAQLAESSLAAVGEKGETDVGRTKAAFCLGPTFHMGDCNSQEFVVGRLTSHVIDYGDEIRWAQKMREQLGTGEEQERNQCAVLSFSAGYEWIKQGNLTALLGLSACRLLPNNTGPLNCKQL